MALRAKARAVGPAFALIGTAASLVVGLATGIALIGEPARLVDVTLLFFSGVGVGAGVVQAIVAGRRGTAVGASHPPEPPREVGAVEHV